MDTLLTDEQLCEKMGWTDFEFACLVIEGLPAKYFPEIMATDGECLTPVFNKAKFAKLFGKSTRTLEKWEQDGMPVLSRDPSGNQYNLNIIQEWHYEKFGHYVKFVPSEMRIVPIEERSPTDEKYKFLKTLRQGRH